METVAKGKEQVLKYLEDEAKKTSKEAGAYVLMRDDSGNLVVVIAGRSFLGTGAYAVDGKRFLILDGLIVQVEE